MNLKTKIISEYFLFFPPEITTGIFNKLAVLIIAKHKYIINSFFPCCNFNGYFLLTGENEFSINGNLVTHCPDYFPLDIYSVSDWILKSHLISSIVLDNYPMVA